MSIARPLSKADTFHNFASQSDGFELRALERVQFSQVEPKQKCEFAGCITLLSTSNPEKLCRAHQGGPTPKVTYHQRQCAATPCDREPHRGEFCKVHARRLEVNACS